MDDQVGIVAFRLEGLDLAYSKALQVKFGVVP